MIEAEIGTAKCSAAAASVAGKAASGSAGANCSIGAWFSNPCQGTSYYGVSTFAMPTTVTFTDTWDNQCAALEARAQ